MKTFHENQAKTLESTIRIGGRHGAEWAGTGAAEAGIALGIDWVVGKKPAHDVAERAEVLDPMTIEQLRAEVESDEASFRVTLDNSDVSIDEPANNLWKGDESKLGIEGRLRFSHRPTGKWNLQLIRREDVKEAVRAFRRVPRKENVGVLL